MSPMLRARPESTVLRADQPQARVAGGALGDDRGRVVGGPVVDDDVLDPALGLAQHRVHRLPDPGPDGVRRRDDGDQRYVDHHPSRPVNLDHLPGSRRWGAPEPGDYSTNYVAYCSYRNRHGGWASCRPGSTPSACTFCSKRSYATLRRPRGYAQMAAAKNLGQQPPLVHLTADKYTVRSYVADTVGEEYLIPLIQVVSHADDLDMGALTDPCVIKGTHGCNMTILLPEGAPRNERAIRATVRPLARHRLLPDGLARGALPRAAAAGGGRAVHRRRAGRRRRTTSSSCSTGRSAWSSSTRTASPRTPHAAAPGLARVRRRRRHVRRGRRAARRSRRTTPRCWTWPQRLAADFAFARIDLYNVDGRIYFGEITHNPGGGLVRLRPRAFDRALGELWRNGTPIPERFIRRPPRSNRRSRSGDRM